MVRPLKEKVSITLDSDLLDKVKYVAEKDDRSLSQYINMVLRRHINRIAQKKNNSAKKEQ